MTIPETVGGSGVKLIGVGTTVAEEVGGRMVVEGVIAGEVGSDDTGCLTEVGKTFAGSVGVGECEASVVGDNALAL
jgi:hypothetical protein